MKLDELTRDELGRLVRETWVQYCIETGDFKPSHVKPYDQLTEWEQEADRRIGEAVQQRVKAHFRRIGEQVVGYVEKRKQGKE